MERAESEVTPVFIAFPLKEEDGAKAEAEAARAERMNATVFILEFLGAGQSDSY